MNWVAAYEFKSVRADSMAGIFGRGHVTVAIEIAQQRTGGQRGIAEQQVCVENAAADVLVVRFKMKSKFRLPLTPE